MRRIPATPSGLCGTGGAAAETLPAELVARATPEDEELFECDEPGTDRLEEDACEDGRFEEKEPDDFDDFAEEDVFGEEETDDARSTCTSIDCSMMSPQAVSTNSSTRKLPGLSNACDGGLQEPAPDPSPKFQEHSAESSDPSAVRASRFSDTRSTPRRSPDCTPISTGSGLSSFGLLSVGMQYARSGPKLIPSPASGQESASMTAAPKKKPHLPTFIGKRQSRHGFAESPVLARSENRPGSKRE